MAAGHSETLSLLKTVPYLAILPLKATSVLTVYVFSHLHYFVVVMSVVGGGGQVPNGSSNANHILLLLL